jgi:gliding motility-associated lipoprotein GldD
MKNLVIGILALLIFLSSCEESYTPKRKGYPRIIFPTGTYQTFDLPGFPYTFEYPTYAQVIRDTVFFNEPTENPYWINIDFPSLGGKIYISYKIIGAQYSLKRLMEDAFQMTYKHSVRADFINEKEYINNERKVYAVFFDVGGDAATAKQFYATDSTNHFLRGALYFDVRPNADSLKPVNDFLQQDMQHIIQTLRWR